MTACFRMWLFRSLKKRTDSGYGLEYSQKNFLWQGTLNAMRSGELTILGFRPERLGGW